LKILFKKHMRSIINQQKGSVV